MRDSLLFPTNHYYLFKIMSSGGEQSEDGELRQSPQEGKKESDISLSEEDGEAVDDSLDIKPPQAKVSQNLKLKRRDHTERSRHKKSEKHREDRHLHREKHHREKQMRSTKDREYYQKERDKERYYREKTMSYDQLMSESQQYMKEKSHRERKEDRSRYLESRKREEKVNKDVREVRYSSRDNEKHRRRHEEDKRGDRALHDLRERLLSKRKVDDESGHERRHSKESHRSHKRRRQNEILETALEGESGMYVKEIISISGVEERSKLKKEDKKEEDHATDKERAEQDQRKEKLLEAEREIARLKEQTRLDRERRHQEKEKFNKHKEELEDHYSKRTVTEEIISDNSEDEPESPEIIMKRRDSNEKDEDVTSEKSYSSSRSRSRSRSSERSERSGSSRRSESRERSRSTDRSRSATKSPDSIEDRKSEERDMDNPEHQKEKKPKELDEDLPPYYPAISGCRSVEEFQCLNRIEEGTYGVVYRARDKRTDEIVALKRLKMEKEKEGFPITSLREINTLLKGQHKNIVTVREIVVGSNMDKIFIVMDYVEHDLKSLMETMRHKKQGFTPAEVKCLLQQLLLAVAHLHDNWILHRDLKTSNLLLSHKGILKVGDFGLAREYGSPLKAYTPIVVTLWYRAPELLLCTKEYSTHIDMWSVGCIFAELTLMNALFPGKTEVDQLNRIFKELGTPNEKIWPGFNKLPAVQKMKFAEYPRSNLRLKFHGLTESGLDLILQFLTYDPIQRITAEQALKHSYFIEAPLPIDPAMFPTWPAKSELGQKRVLASPKPPSGGGEYKKLRADGDDYGFRIGMGQDRTRGGMGFSLKF
ncbi:hypothetical protein WA026_021412 [Henosepilachna vigintioctopunctata]|uniref:cyclin-dependent kinase n=1 Tax=Henosepilachna vigintioctopunctata TaxID=420089 RepID=A0AAW1U1D2_9CUCU